MLLWIFSSSYLLNFPSCSKPPSRDNHPEACYPRTIQYDRVQVEPRLCNQGRRKNDAFTLLAALPTLQGQQNSNQIYHCTHCITSKRVTNLPGSSLRLWAAQTPFKDTSQRWRAIGNTVSDLTARDLYLKPHHPETNALPFDQLANFIARNFTNLADIPDPDNLRLPGMDIKVHRW